MAKKTVAQMRKRSRAQLTAAMLRDNVTYHPDSGEFWTKPRRIGTVQFFGKRRDPAVTLTLKGKDGKWRKYYAHILAWLWMTGEWPREEIDHIHNDPTDNRWKELREATHTENNRNKDFRGRNKFVGASFHKASGL